MQDEGSHVTLKAVHYLKKNSSQELISKFKTVLKREDITALVLLPGLLEKQTKSDIEVSISDFKSAKDSLHLQYLTQPETELFWTILSVLEVKWAEFTDKELGLLTMSIRFQGIRNAYTNPQLPLIAWEQALLPDFQAALDNWLQTGNELNVSDYSLESCCALRSLQPLIEDVYWMQYKDDLDLQLYAFSACALLLFVIVTWFTYLYSESCFTKSARWRYELVLFNLTRLGLILAILNIIVICFS